MALPIKKCNKNQGKEAASQGVSESLCWRARVAVNPTKPAVREDTLLQHVAPFPGSKEETAGEQAG